MRPLVKVSVVVSLVLCIVLGAYLYFSPTSTVVGDRPIVLEGQMLSDGQTTIRLSWGGDPIPDENIRIEFGAYLGGRDNIEAEFVQGEIIDLDNDPVISWDTAPTATNVSIANVPGDLDETWDLIFQVDDANYFADVTKLRITLAPTGGCIFWDDFVLPPT